MKWKLGHLVVLWLTTAALSATQAQDRPKVLAFFVGIEHYANSDLDKLEYAADDARALYDQLRVIADVHKDSKLLVADDQNRSMVKAEVLRAELRKFLKHLADGSNVVIYLGGHGTLSIASKLLYLASDYDPDNGIGDIKFDEIQQWFDDEIRGRRLTGVKITFLVNMCGAGNAVAPAGMNAMAVTNPETIDIARKLYEQLNFGQAENAIIPATAANRNTYEDPKLGRSVYAYHLLNALRGQAANAEGSITTGHVYNHLKNGLGADVPKNPNFSKSIVLGMTRRLEGESAFRIGTALQASARALQVQKTAEAVKPSVEQTRQARLLNDLAAEQFRRVPSRHPELASRAQLRMFLAKYGADDVTPPEADTARLRGLAKDTSLSERERTFIAQLSGPAAPGTLTTFNDLQTELQNNSFNLLFVNTTFQSASSPRSTNPFEKEQGRLFEVMRSFAGVRDIRRIGLDYRQVTPEAILQPIDQWTREYATANSKPHRLVVVYTGLAGITGNHEECLKANSTAVCLVVPFGADLIRRIATTWGGAVTIIYDAPFGGVLFEVALENRVDVSMLLAGRARNSMTFGGANCSNTAKLAQAFQDGLKAALDDLERDCASVTSMPSEYTLAKPVWIPSWIGSGRPTTLPGDPLAALDRLVVLAAGRCLERLDGCAPAIVNSATFGDEFDALARGVKLDKEGQYEKAREAYEVAADALNAAAKLAGARKDDPGEAKRIADILAVASGKVRSRVDDADWKKERKVVVLPVAIETYTHRSMADVPHAAADVQAYGQVLAAQLQSPSSRIEVRQPLSPANAEELRKALKDEAAKLSSADLLIFVFSGRAFERNGRRYLVMAGAEPIPEQGGARGQLSLTWSNTQVIDLWTLAQNVDGIPFVGVYDTQFTTPKIDATRVDQYLDRSADPPRPSAGKGRDSNEFASEQAGEIVRHLAVSRRSLPAGQVHIWVDGNPTQPYKARHPCLPPEAVEVASPLAAALLTTLPDALRGTYRDWLEKAGKSPCLATFGKQDRLVFQGQLDVPLFASGKGIEVVAYYFDKDRLRRDINMEAAVALATSASELFPTWHNRLALAALLVARAQFQNEAMLSIDGDKLRDKWLREARDYLERMAPSDMDGDEHDLHRAIRLELLSREALLSEQPERGARALHDATPDGVLLNRSLAERLVTMTEAALRGEPDSLLARTREKLDKTDSRKESVAAARAALLKLYDAEKARRAEPFQIGPPDVAPDGRTK